MTTKMSSYEEVLLAGAITLTTVITGSFFADLIAGIIVYFISRLVHHYFQHRVIKIIDSLKIRMSKFKIKRRGKY